MDWSTTLKLLPVFAFVTLQACSSNPASFPTAPRTIFISTQDGETIELQNKDTETWKCRDYVQPGSVLVEVGIFHPTAEIPFGFVLFDGTNSGVYTIYQRQGIERRWDWGKEMNYSMIIKPDGTGLYYDFSTVQPGNSTKARDVYKCRK